MPEVRQTPETPTEVLMRVMESFSDCEGIGVAVLYYDRSGDIKIDTNMRRTDLIGMLELGKQMALFTAPPSTREFS